MNGRPTYLSEDKDWVNPSHYKQLPKNVEVHEIIEAICNRELAFDHNVSYSDLGNILRYLLRLGLKGPSLEELKKIQWYLEKLIAREEKLNGPKDTRGHGDVPGVPEYEGTWVPEADYPDEGD